MEPVVIVEQIEELPWGPGVVNLKQPLEIEVTEDFDTETVTIYCDALGVSGDGSYYTEALLDFAGAVEAQLDTLRSSRRDPSAAVLLAEYDLYLPEED